MLTIEENKKFLIFPSWLNVAYTWEDIPAIIQDPFKHNLAWKYNYTKEEIEGYGYSFDVPVDILNGPCGGGILVQHPPKGKAWAVRGALTFDKGADIRSPQYLESYGREFRYNKLNVAHLEHRAHAGSLYRFDKPPKNPMLYCSVEHTDCLIDSEMYWLVTGRSPGKSEMLYELPTWAKAFDVDLKIVSKVDSALEEFIKSWVPDKLKHVWLRLTSNNRGLGFHFAVLMYFGFHLATTEKRRMKSMHLLADIEGEPKLFSNRKDWLDRI
ncbi:MAG: hypothetical protein JXA82_09770 [Sedimentisphaerales bacterium]|nr:hypothetical protein [Sedimentisphaerales bacterium]